MKKKNEDEEEKVAIYMYVSKFSLVNFPQSIRRLWNCRAHFCKLQLKGPSPPPSFITLPSFLLF